MPPKDFKRRPPSPQERETARLRLGELADRFTVEGTLRTAPWQAVYRRTWRHPYVPCYYSELGAGPLVSAADEQQRARWLAAVYSNETLITKVIQVPSRHGGSYPRFTSSSTVPSLLLTMLEALDVTDGCPVLEIGTGSGYHTALLCERLASQYVTSVDIDPDLVALARQRLAAHSYTPTLATTDGADGYPRGAPYDRIIATCSVPAIPPAWLAQATPGAIIIADVRGPWGGTVVRLRMNNDGVATGRFLPGYASFMPLRPAVDTFPSPPPRLTLAQDAVDSLSNVDPKLLRRDTHIGFVMQWHLPEVTWRHAHAADGDLGLQLEAPDGSGAQAWHTPENGSFPIRQSGPRRLWDRVEQAHQFWQHAGRPNYDRFGITAHTTEQHVWYDHPNSPHRWPLPTPTGPRTIQSPASQPDAVKPRQLDVTWGPKTEDGEAGRLR